MWSAEAVAVLLALVQSVAVARLLGVSDYGRSALVLALPALVFQVLDPQTEEAVVRYATTAGPESPVSPREVLRLALRLDLGLAVASSLISCGVVIVRPTILGLSEADLRLVAGGCVIAAATAPTASYRGVLTAVGDFRSISLVGLAVAGLKCLAAIGGAATSGVGGFVMGLAAAALAEPLLNMIAVRRHLSSLGPRTGRWRLDLAGERSNVLRFIAITNLTTLSSAFVKNLDVLILGARSTDSEVGLYRLARSAVAPAGAVLRPLQTTAYRTYASLSSTDAGELRAQLRTDLLRVGPILGAVGIAGAGILPWIIPGLVGSAYDEAVPAALVLSLGAVFGIATFSLRPAALVLQLERKLLYVSVSMTVLTSIGYLVLAESGGAVGIAASRTAFAAILGPLLVALSVRRRVR